MTQTTDDLPRHHKHCDALFATAEELAHKGEWPQCEVACQAFERELEAHFSTEEQVLFPAFENATGMRGGPTHMMRVEHAQMRELVAQMNDASARRRRDAFAGIADTLLILMQQHNMKEENILYPMCNQALASGSLNLAGALRDRAAGACAA